MIFIITSDRLYNNQNWQREAAMINSRNLIALWLISHCCLEAFTSTHLAPISYTNFSKCHLQVSSVLNNPFWLYYESCHVSLYLNGNCQNCCIFVFDSNIEDRRKQATIFFYFLLSIFKISIISIWCMTSTRMNIESNFTYLLAAVIFKVLSL